MNIHQKLKIAIDALEHYECTHYTLDGLPCSHDRTATKALALLREPSEEVAEQKQEVVSDGSLFITRLKVPGGRIYNSYDKSCGVLGSCFVPELKNEDEAREILGKK